MDRRTFLERLGTGLAFAAVAACTRAPKQKIVPYVRAPETQPGVGVRYATSFVDDGYAIGLLAESHEGRPTKIEGNPRHPACLGGTSAIHQAWVQQLYLPARAEHKVRREALVGDVQVMMRPTSSPLAIARIARLRDKHPRARITFSPSCAPMNAWEGARRAFGRVLEADTDVGTADVVVAIDDDMLSSGPRALRDARRFGERREHLTLWAVEPALTCTGIAADVRLRMRSSEIASFIRDLLCDSCNERLPADVVAALRAIPRTPDERRTRLADALRNRRAVLRVGASQPPEVHVLVHALHAVLGTQQTLRPSPIFEAGEPSFTHAFHDGAVLLCDVDPRFDLRAHEPPPKNAISIPIRHGLETWGDARAFDGTLGIVQPLIAPLWDHASVTEVLALLAGETLDDYTSLRESHREGWELALQSGFIENTAFTPVESTLDGAAVVAAARAIHPRESALEIRYPLDPRVHDGRFSAVPWLLELPDPITKHTWRNAARLSPATARKFGVATGDEIEITVDDRSVRAPAIVSPGDADDCITLPRGWPEANASIRGAHYEQASLRKTGTHVPLAITQEHTRQEGRPIALRRGSHEEKTEQEKKPSLYRLPLVGSPMGNHWGMVIDLSMCTGCSACVVACVAENNIPIVGEAGVREHREMHWLRIDRYDDGTEDDPQVITQPMMCQHCEHAPCEYVCPVNATVHSPDGLNEQLYHRCIGTRFCSNNCPYKVRRFNWFKYQHPEGNERLVLNPDVTVRGRGVMEKCTFCVQRIRETELAARVEDRRYRDGDVKTACQEACPTGAIVFGSIGDPNSAVSQARECSYAVLDDLGTEPRVRYLAKVTR